MSVPAIALYPIPPASVCGSSCDHDPSPNPKSITGGLSRIFSSSPSTRHSPASSLSFAGGDEAADLALSSSLSYSCSPSRGFSSSSFRNSAGKDRIFGSFIRNALGSCFDQDSPRVSNGVGVDVEEFGFDFGESFVEPRVREMLAGAQSRHKIFYEDFVVRAFYEAEKAHRGQMRASGDPYLQHCVETAVLLAKIGANCIVVAAGLLHDTLDDSFMDYDYIHGRFGAGLADLVEGVSKLSQLSKLAREKNTANRSLESDRLHTMFLAMADARAVLIKIADRLHNMMTLEALPMVKQQRFAKETLEIFVPLASRLGIFSWKEKLENLCFKFLFPQQHKLLSSKLLRSFDEAMIASAIHKLEQALQVGGVSYHALYGRHKSLYSIHSKMVKKNLTMDEIHDIHGLRLIVEKEEDCYIALNIVHQLWPKVLGKLKDYIAHPKLNGYQSLQTVVVSEGTVPLEVQIRTKEMHLRAECGFAAHWRYKEGDCEHSSFVLQMVEWARWIVTWQCETINADRPSSYGDADSIRPLCPFPSHMSECAYSSSRSWCDNSGPIFVILLENEKMSVQEFAPNSTVMDLLERCGRGSPRGSRYNFPLKQELRPRLNHKPVDDPNLKLKMGDVVELSPAIPDGSLTGYREEIQRMYDRGMSISRHDGKRR